MREKKFWNPYIAGIALGLVLLASFLIVSHGLGASGGATRIGVFGLSCVVHEHTKNNPYFSKYLNEGTSPLDSWLFMEVIGVFLGGFLAASLGGRVKSNIIKGPRISKTSRLVLAFIGGAFMGFASRLARGCTSGQALTGGALLSVGSWIFMFSIFAGGYLFAYFLRRQWL